MEGIVTEQEGMIRFLMKEPEEFWLYVMDGKKTIPVGSCKKTSRKLKPWDVEKVVHEYLSGSRQCVVMTETYRAGSLNEAKICLLEILKAELDRA